MPRLQLRLHPQERSADPRTLARRRRLRPLGWLLPLLLTASVVRAGEPLPGAPPHPPELRTRLAETLADRGPDYVPRTRNLRDDGTPRFTNRLLLESSPYLRQHAHNPVDWYPWGDEAFDAATRLGRPVLVSIGYSTCHWCHVMEEESFDDPETAAYLNEHFIAIKVDREVRPDVDAVYMAAIHAMNGSGGWPLNVFVTPDRKPFYGGTYFPPRDRGGRLGFATVLRTIVAGYADDPARIAGVADRISATIAEQLENAAANASVLPDPALLIRAREEFAAGIDREWGGSGRGMKFPSSVPVVFLLRTDGRPGGQEARRLVELTLERMAAGGIHDPIGGGFHRYATDPRWLVPHFEKMLYDNALIARAYTEAFEATRREEFADVVRTTLDYVAAEMTAPGGGFYSATDADSATPAGESEEGRFFTWTPKEIEAAVGADDAPIVSAYFGADESGNLDGRSVLHTWRSVQEIADAQSVTPATVRAAISRARPRLYAARAERPPPFRDEKILAGWNGLMISALARAGTALAEPERTRAAARAADFVLLSMREGRRLRRVYKDGHAEGPAFLEDYAFLIAGLLDLFEADQNLRWLREAVALQSILDSDHADELGGGYFATSNDHEPLLAREKPNRDDAIPAGNSVAAQNLVRLAAYTLDASYRERAVTLFSAFHDLMERSPTRLPEMLIALDALLGPSREILLVHPASRAAADELREVVRNEYVPNRVFAEATEGADLEEKSQLIPLLTGKVVRNGRTTAYVCEDRVCRFPTNDPDVLAALLRNDPDTRSAPAPHPLDPSSTDARGRSGPESP